MRRTFAMLRVRVGPAEPGGTVIELGGLARTEAAGYGEEFDRIAADLLPPGAAGPAVPAGVLTEGR